MCSYRCIQVLQKKKKGKDNFLDSFTCRDNPRTLKDSVVTRTC